MHWRRAWGNLEEEHLEEWSRWQQKLDNFMTEVIHSTRTDIMLLSLAFHDPRARPFLISGDFPESCCIQRHRHLRRNQGRVHALRFV